MLSANYLNLPTAWGTVAIEPEASKLEIIELISLRSVQDGFGNTGGAPGCGVYPGVVQWGSAVTLLLSTTHGESPDILFRLLDALRGMLRRR